MPPSGATQELDRKYAHFKPHRITSDIDSQDALFQVQCLGFRVQGFTSRETYQTRETVFETEFRDHRLAIKTISLSSICLALCKARINSHMWLVFEFDLWKHSYSSCLQHGLEQTQRAFELACTMMQLHVSSYAVSNIFLSSPLQRHLQAVFENHVFREKSGV